MWKDEVMNHLDITLHLKLNYRKREHSNFKSYPQSSKEKSLKTSFISLEQFRHTATHRDSMQIIQSNIQNAKNHEKRRNAQATKLQPLGNRRIGKMASI